MANDTIQAALPYREPSIEVILVQSSFLVLLNVLNWALDSLLYCGSIGQILVGIAWGVPGGNILGADAENIAVQLGYLGIILLVFEGGLSTSLPSIRANLALSVGVAATGIAAPIGLSFILAPMVGASYLQCFAAGAALCSTSLGTTFAVLRASGLTTTRLGVVLTSAAMLDDVVGLVMVQVISNLGAPGASISAVAVARPVLVSIAFVAAAVGICRYLVTPATVLLNQRRIGCPSGILNVILCRHSTALTLHSALLFGLVAASSYAGTSNLFAAYIAGSVISWWDAEVPHISSPAGQPTENTPSRVDQPESRGEEVDGHGTSASPRNCPAPIGDRGQSTTGIEIFELYYQPAVKRVLQPFFFASIGFSIPITKMFTGSVVWRGIVYALFMAMGKLLCGLWIVRAPGFLDWIKSVAEKHTLQQVQAPRTISTCIKIRKPQNRSADSAIVAAQIASPTVLRNTLTNPPNPLSLYPSAILGAAMVSRGEIGFLISSVAQGNGLFGNDQRAGESTLSLVVTWAVVLCTLVGPLTVGTLVRRVRRLENKGASSAVDEGDTSSKDVLGVWGVQP